MAPGAGPLPSAAELGVDREIAKFVAGLSGRGRMVVRLALAAVEWLPWPWRFSRQELEARERFLRDMDSSGVGWVEDLLLFLKVLVGVGYGSHPRVSAAIGYEMTCRVAEGDLPPEGSDPKGTGPTPLGDVRPRVEGEEADVVVIGSGAGGAVAAAVLAEAGLDVVVLEAGPYLDRRSYRDDPLPAIESLYRANGLTVAEGRPMIPVPIGRAVGGTTVINSGTCFRAPDHVLASWAAEHGVDWATR